MLDYFEAVYSVSADSLLTVISTVDGPRVSFQDFITGEEEIKRGVVSVQISGGRTKGDISCKGWTKARTACRRW